MFSKILKRLYIYIHIYIQTFKKNKNDEFLLLFTLFHQWKSIRKGILATHVRDSRNILPAAPVDSLPNLQYFHCTYLVKFFFYKLECFISVFPRKVIGNQKVVCQN